MLQRCPLIYGLHYNSKRQFKKNIRSFRGGRKLGNQKALYSLKKRRFLEIQPPIEETRRNTVFAGAFLLSKDTEQKHRLIRGTLRGNAPTLSIYQTHVNKK